MSNVNIWNPLSLKILADADPSILIPGVAGKKNLERMHDSVAEQIRRVDTRHNIFFEPVTWGMVFDGTASGSGFDHVPGGPEYANRSVFSYHYYCASFVPDYQKSGFWRKTICDHTLVSALFHKEQ